MHLFRILGILTIGLIPLSPVPQASGNSTQLRVLHFVRDPWREVIGSDSPRFALYD